MSEFVRRGKATYFEIWSNKVAYFEENSCLYDEKATFYNKIEEFAAFALEKGNKRYEFLND